MCLLEVLRWIFSGGSDEEQQRSYRRLPSVAEPPPPAFYYSHSSRNKLQANNDLEGAFPCSSLFPSSNPALSSSSHRSSTKPSLSSSGPSSNSALSSSLRSPKPTLSSLPSSNPLASRASPSALPCSQPSSSKPSTSSNASSKPSTSSLPSPNSTLSSLPSSNPLASSASPSALPCSRPSSSKPSTSSNASSKPSASSLPSPKPNLPSLPSSNPLASSASPSTLLFSRHPSSKPSTSSNASPTLHLSPFPTTTAAATQSEERRTEQLERYEIPKHLVEQIKKDVVPEVLRRPLTPSTYAHYFAALLYAEDFYIEKWSKFLLSGVTLKLQRRETFEKISRENKNANETILMDKKPFVSFEIDAIPEERPYLLSRDFVFLKGSCKTAEPFKGVLFRVVKSTTVLVDFRDDFHSQHSPSNKYDVSFSFNRVCLKRSHQAISAAKDSSFHDVLFPTKPNTASISSFTNTIHLHRNLASRVVNHRGPTPYLIEGTRSATGIAIQQAILKIYSTSPHCRILICAPTNQLCDSLMRSLHSQIPREKLFRANAAFRDYDLVPGDIIPQSLYEGERFTCPSPYELQDFKVITSTYVSSFRLHTAGLEANHFTHIFLADAASAMEPEVVVPIANFVGKNTVIVATGSSGDCPRWVRSDMARRHGLKRSYFKRLLEREPYLSRDPAFITHFE